MFRLNCRSHNMSITIRFQSLVRAAVLNTDAQGGESAAAALDDLLSTQPRDVREACINLAYWLLDACPCWFDEQTLDQSVEVLECTFARKPRGTIEIESVRRADTYWRAWRGIAHITLQLANDQQIRAYLRLREAGVAQEAAAREVMAR